MLRQPNHDVALYIIIGHDKQEKKKKKKERKKKVFSTQTHSECPPHTYSPVTATFFRVGGETFVEGSPDDERTLDHCALERLRIRLYQLPLVARECI